MKWQVRVGMNALVISIVRVLRNAGVAILLFLNSGFSSQGHIVSIGFDYPNLIPPGSFPVNWHLPWHEDGFTTARLSGATDAVGIRATGRGLPPYPGTLYLTSRGLVVSSVTITNDSFLTFDLLSLDLLSIGTGIDSTTNFARVTSSAGGAHDLFGTTPGTTLSFSGVQWENLSFVNVEFLSSDVFSAGGVELDNFVLQPNSVPEPSSFWLGIVSLSGWFWIKFKAPRRQCVVFRFCF